MNGLEVEFLNGQTNLKGGLAAICGDKLGTNGIAGMILSEVVDESQVEFRTKSNYQRDVDASEANGKTVNGVKCYCILNQLNFYIIDAPTVDIMHDILEGVGQCSVKEFLTCIISEKLLTEQQINERIAAFE